MMIPTRDFRSPCSSSSAVGLTDSGVATSAELGVMDGAGMSAAESGVVEGAGMSSDESVLFSFSMDSYRNKSRQKDGE